VRVARRNTTSRHIDVFDDWPNMAVRRLARDDEAAMVHNLLSAPEVLPKGMYLKSHAYDWLYLDACNDIYSIVAARHQYALATSMAEMRDKIAAEIFNKAFGSTDADH